MTGAAIIYIRVFLTLNNTFLAEAEETQEALRGNEQNLQDLRGPPLKGFWGAQGNARDLAMNL